jgi:hypothetical protein
MAKRTTKLNAGRSGRPFSLECVLRDLHDGKINAGAGISIGIQTLYDMGMAVWIGDRLTGMKESTIITPNGTRGVRRWPEEDAAARWLHETALRLFPDSPYAKEHNAEAPNKPTNPAKN